MRCSTYLSRMDIVTGVDFVSVPETGTVTLSVVNPEKMDLALHVEDVGAARATLEERGVSFMGDVFDTGVCHMAFFADPDGNMLMLHHRYAPRVPENGS